VAGQAVARAVFREVDAELIYTVEAPDGQDAGRDQVIASIEGRARAVLTGERTALNFLQRLSGIATLTARFVRAAQPLGTVILDTRKTTPTLRGFEKYAVTCGGGVNHRMGLYDMILIKDNHRALWNEHGRLADAVRAARRRFPGVPVEVEIESESELLDALEATPEWLMLDNMTPDRMRGCVELVSGRCQLEASGGVTLDTVAAVAATGVNAVSLGCLTHSAPAADLSLEMSLA